MLEARLWGTKFFSSIDGVSPQLGIKVEHPIFSFVSQEDETLLIQVL